MNNMRNKILMTLALLLTAVTGAWAQGDKKYNITFKANGNTTTVENVMLPHMYCCNWDDEMGCGTDELDLIIQELYGLNGGQCTTTAPVSDNASVICGVDEDFQYITVNAPFEGTATVTGKYYNSGYFDYSLEITCVDPNAEPEPEPTDPNALTVEWNPATKTGNFKMPAYDVEIAPIYAPVAQWAKVDNVDQLPTAIEGIYAESTDAIVKAGTVAKIGETENPQGTVMYAVTSTNQATAPALDAFSADVPTAENITIGSEVLVWYYIKGADTPEGEEATAENTFNDSEICAEPITVTLLSNKFDIQFKAANDNTIEAGKATVKVGDEAAEVKEGKLTGVKMNSKVTVTAKEGYKFRKVEVKKKAAAPAYTLLDNTMTAWTAGKYAVPAGGLTYSAAITVSGDVTLVLTDGETLTLNKGISLAEGATLTIQGNGTMNINGTNNSTASTVAGTGMLVLTSGTLNAKGGNGDGLIITDSWLDNENNIGVSGGVAINGNVTVNGGTVTATGGNGGILDTSQIVGGYNNHGGNGGAAISGTVTVNAGGWTATNGSNGTYTPGSDDNGCSAGTGGKAVAGTVTDNR